MDTRMIEGALAQSEALEPMTQANSQPPSERSTLPGSSPLSSNPFTAPGTQAPQPKMADDDEEEEEKSVSMQTPASFSLTAESALSSAPALEEALQKLKVVNIFRSLIKNLPEQFRVRKNDLRYDRNSAAYRKLVAARFDFKGPLAELEIKFRENKLDTTLITKAINLCSTIQESIECSEKPGSLPQSALSLWVNDLIRDTDAFCDSIDDQYLEPHCKLAPPKKDKVIASLDSLTYEQHFNFCLCALNAIECKDYPALTSIAWELATSFNPKTSGKIEEITEQEFKDQIKSKREVDAKLMQIALKLFRDTVEQVKAQAWDDFLSYIVTIQPSEPVYEEKEREEKHLSGLQQHHMHASSTSAATSHSGPRIPESASGYKHS